MEIIGVSGSASKSGKTTFISKLLKNTKYYTGVIKTSVNENLADYLVTTDQKLINKAGTDTARLKENGADRVVLLKSSPSDLPQAYQMARELIGEVERLYIEGNSLLSYLNPDLIFYLKNGETEKKSAQIIKKRAQIWIETTNLFQNKELSNLLFKFNVKALTCYQAHLLADLLTRPIPEIGLLIDKSDIKVKKCQLGLF